MVERKSNTVFVFDFLFKVAKDYLAIQGSSIPSERSFSSSGLTITKLRNALNPDIVKQLMCLKSWFKSELLLFLQLSSNAKTKINK